MAIVGLVITGLEGQMKALHQRLEGQPGIVEVQDTEDALRLAAVMETASDRVESGIAALLKWEEVLSADVAYISYEDDMAAGREIPCPPHEPKQKKYQ